jgi:tRNA (mo5U34)-methyltransferase
MSHVSAGLEEAVRSNQLWYHTIDLAPGVVTPGWFDLRPIVGRLPWPDIAGRRCLDVGTYDGFFAFEMERRGAAEVVAIDLSDHTEWDWPPDARAQGPAALARMAGPEKGRGFRIAAEALGSSVQLVNLSVYGLSPDVVGTFDVVVCGSLLLHLRDPLGALEAIRSVCAGVFLSAEEIDLWLTVWCRRQPIARLNGAGTLTQWWVPNSAGHRQMIFAAGFEVLERTRPYAVPFGAAHPRLGPRERLRRQVLERALAGGPGVPHAAVLARPRL